MKKLFNILIIFLICIFIFIVFDYLQYKQACIQRYKQDPNKLYPPEEYINFFKYDIGNTLQILKNFSQNIYFFRNNIANTDANKKPSIILFGCSFVYGTMLEDNKTLSYKLSKLTKRNVYNRACEACGIQHMYYFLSDDNFYNNISPPPPIYYLHL